MCAAVTDLKCKCLLFIKTISILLDLVVFGLVNSIRIPRTKNFSTLLAIIWNAFEVSFYVCCHNWPPVFSSWDFSTYFTQTLVTIIFCHLFDLSVQFFIIHWARQIQLTVQVVQSCNFLDNRIIWVAFLNLRSLNIIKILVQNSLLLNTYCRLIRIGFVVLC